MKRRIISLVLVSVLAFSMAIPAAAASTQNVDITYRAIKISLNGKEITPCDEKGNTIEPFIMNSNGTTYLPLRAIAQALGLGVKWVAETSTVELSSGGEVKTGRETAVGTKESKTVSITYRDIKVFLDGVQLELVNANGATVEPFIMNGTTYLPLRVVGEALGLEVGWDGKTNTATLNNSVSVDEIYIWLYNDEILEWEKTKCGETVYLNMDSVCWFSTSESEPVPDKSVVWTVSDESVAVAGPRTFLIKKAGTVTVTLTAPNGTSASVKVVIQDADERLAEEIYKKIEEDFVLTVSPQTHIGDARYMGNLTRAEFVEEFYYGSEAWDIAARRFAEDGFAMDKYTSLVGFYLYDLFRIGGDVYLGSVFNQTPSYWTPADQIADENY